MSYKDPCHTHTHIANVHTFTTCMHIMANGIFVCTILPLYSFYVSEADIVSTLYIHRLRCASWNKAFTMLAHTHTHTRILKRGLRHDPFPPAAASASFYIRPTIFTIPILIWLFYFISSRQISSQTHQRKRKRELSQSLYGQFLHFHPGSAIQTRSYCSLLHVAHNARKTGIPSE